MSAGLLTLGCGALGSEPQRLRVTNHGGAPIADLSVRFPQDRISFGDVPAGATTPYREVPNGVYGYAAYSLEIGGTTVTQPLIDWVGEERARLIAAARAIMLEARYCTLVTIGRDGRPQARLVDPLAPEADLSVWIATSPVTRKVDEIRADPRVTLFYFDRSGPAYVTLHATAELVTDAALKAAHWKEAWAPFYKDGHRGGDFVLIRSKPARLEIVSQRHGILNDPVSWRPTTIELP